MSGFSPADLVKSGVTELLMQLLTHLPGWEGPSRNQFDSDIRNLVESLEHTETDIGVVYLTEVAAKMVSEGVA